MMDEAILRRIIADEVARAIESLRAAIQVPAAAPLIDADEFAALLGVHARTVHRMELAGDVPAALRIGGKTVRWPRDVVDEFLRTGRVDSPAKPLSIRRRRA